MIYIPHPERLSPVFQATLLRLLRKYGANAPRIVAFAGRSLRTLFSTTGFSAELADYLGALRIAIPALRERREDISQLLTHLLQNIAVRSGAPLPDLAPDLIDAARHLPWRGNLPQLSAAAEALMERSTHLILHAQDLNAVLGAISAPITEFHGEVRMMRLDDIIQEHIRAVLSACNGNKLRTAEILGISRSTLYRMLETNFQPSSPALAAASLQMTH
jgi:DNA-binding NtrC family response regulator